MRRVEDITEALWGSKVLPATISELNKKAYVHIEDWRDRLSSEVQHLKTERQHGQSCVKCNHHKNSYKE